MVRVQNFEVMSNKFNVGKIYTEVITLIKEIIIGNIFTIASNKKIDSTRIQSYDLLHTSLVHETRFQENCSVVSRSKWMDRQLNTISPLCIHLVHSGSQK
jgi:hypothetical protein